MRIEHLVSTMYKKTPEFVYGMNCREDVLIVNQTDVQGQSLSKNGTRQIRMLSTVERGLSNSRNMLIENAEGDIAIVGDDDLLYLDGYEKVIREAYMAYPEADIIAFRFTQSLEGETRHQFKKEKWLNIFSISKVASVEVTFRLNRIREKKLKFCPLLGLGAKYGACEENAFLADALRSGLKILYIPQTICYLEPDPPERVKWQNGFDQEYFIKRGAGFYRIYGKLFLPFSLAFLLLKKRSLFHKIGIVKALRWMYIGKKEFQKDERMENVS